MYLPYDEMNKKIDRYIKNQNTEYAILLNGKWGCGKTYFIRNDFFSKMVIPQK